MALASWHRFTIDLYVPVCVSVVVFRTQKRIGLTIWFLAVEPFRCIAHPNIRHFQARSCLVGGTRYWLNHLRQKSLLNP